MRKWIAMKLVVPWFFGRIPKLLFLAVLIILAVPHFASSATFTVSSTADANDLSPGNGVCETAPGNGVCTLRAAIQESNAVPGFPPAQINVPSGTYVLTGGPLEIRSSLFLKGSDQKTTFIDGNLTSQVLLVFGDDDPIVNISDVTIQNGRGGSGVSGGGLVVRQGAFVNLERSTVQDNRTSAPGGGISNGGFIQLVETTVRENVVPISGMGDTGGVQHSGGGIVNFSGATLKIISSAILANSATRGGGIRNFGGHMEISNSTISGNSALARGGGIMNFGTAWLAFSTITNNETDGVSEHPDVPSGGGGIYNDPGVGSDGFTVARVDIGNSIVAGNRDNRSSFSVDYSPDCFSVSPSTFTSFRGNLVSILNDNCNMRDTIFGDTRFDQVGSVANPLNARLDTLTDLNSPTPYHPLLPGSPAIDRGTGVTSATFFDCPDADQRGLTRPVDGNRDGAAECDVGAVEFGAIPPEIVNDLVSLPSSPVTSLSTIPTPNGPAGTSFITATFTNASTIPVRKPFFQVVELSGGNVLINADLGPGGVGAILTPDVGSDRILAPSESVTAEFRIGLQTLNPFTFLVDVMGEPIQ